MRGKLRTMLIVLVLLAVIAPPIHAVAGQWSSNGTSIFYNDGSVGLGTSFPASKLHVAGGDIRLSSGRQLYFEDYGEIKSRDNNHRIIFRRAENKFEIREYGDIILSSGSTSGQETGKLVVRSNGQISLGSTMTFSPTSDSFGTGVRMYMGYGIPMTIFNDGRVGINTFKPTKSLSVNGTILAREVIVSNNAAYWPDYVFDENYELMTLEEVDQFIKENKHLPNIPSQKELSETGELNLGEIQRLQMEKIEELTLHLIEKDKEINDLKTRMENLEKLINNY